MLSVLMMPARMFKIQEKKQYFEFPSRLPVVESQSKQTLYIYEKSINSVIGGRRCQNVNKMPLNGVLVICEQMVCAEFCYLQKNNNNE